MLGKLVFAAMENNEFEVILDPVPATLWTAFGVYPRPSFMLRVPLIYVRPEPEVKLVRKPIVVDFSPLKSLSGIVLGPQNIPIMDAHVELPGMKLSTHTDAKGRFNFPAVPGKAITRHVRVRARGQDVTVNIDEMAGNNGPLIINLQEMEG
jgi:hypothetical protein